MQLTSSFLADGQGERRRRDFHPPGRSRSVLKFAKLELRRLAKITYTIDDLSSYSKFYARSRC